MTEHTKLMRQTERDGLLAYLGAWALFGVACGLVFFAFAISCGGCSASVDQQKAELVVRQAVDLLDDLPSGDPRLDGNWASRRLTFLKNAKPKPIADKSRKATADAATTPTEGK